jgi:hypothetical protein
MKSKITTITSTIKFNSDNKNAQKRAFEIYSEPGGYRLAHFLKPGHRIVFLSKYSDLHIHILGYIFHIFK